MASTATLLLKAGKDRSLARRHPWIYAAAVARVEGAPAAGGLVAVRAADGRFLAWAAYSPSSILRARCWSFEETDRIDAAGLQGRAAAAVRRRAPLRGATDALRLVCGEADGLPGFVADRYGEQLVVQFHAAGVDAQRDALLDALCEASACANVFDRSDPALREREGLAPAGGALRGRAPPALVRIGEHGVRFDVDVRRGHKTGFYIDQRDNRLAAAEQVRRLRERLGRPPRVLNCFCYTGGFSLAAALAGAAQVDSVDSSADALALAQGNAALNGLADGKAGGNASGGGSRLQWHCADVFEKLRALRDQGARYELVILDPPKFATNPHQVERAARAYKDINLGALRLLEPGGILMTFSCSGAVDVDLFQKIVAGAMFDAQVDGFLRRRLGAGEDHPVLMTHPEGEYLKGLEVERV